MEQASQPWEYQELFLMLSGVSLIFTRNPAGELPCCSWPGVVAVPELGGCRGEAVLLPALPYTLPHSAACDSSGSTPGLGFLSVPLSPYTSIFFLVG